jgi:hypothetical protein
MTVERPETSGPARSSRLTRADVVHRSAVAAGTALLGGVLAGALSPPAVSVPSAAQDVKILNFALLLEYLQSSFYEDALARGGLSGELREFAETVGGHEQEHVEFLRGALGQKARAKPRFDFGRATTSPKRFTASALVMEDLGVVAYNGQAANLTKRSLGAAAEIVSVEARHSAWIRDILGLLPAPHPADVGQSARRVAARLKATGFLRSS